jgi:energy-coupling factor transport system permease protein
MDARVKLISMIALVVLLFTNLELPGFGLMTLFVLILLKVSKVGYKSFFKTAKTMLFMFLLLCLFNVFIIRTGSVAFYVGDYAIYTNAILQSSYIFFRLLLMLAFTMILTSTTKPLDMTYAVEFYLRPLGYLKFPYQKVAMTISIALRFIPTLMDETNKIMNAQSSRGVNYESGGLKEKVGSIISLIIPLLVASLEHSDQLADAMVVRGYNPDAKRTRYRKFKIAARDIISIILVIGIIVVGIYAKDFTVMILERLGYTYAL